MPSATEFPGFATPLVNDSNKKASSAFLVVFETGLLPDTGYQPVMRISFYRYKHYFDF